MFSSRTTWFVGLLLLSAGGLLVAGLLGLQRGVRDAEAAADAEARRRARTTAGAIRDRLLSPELSAALPPDQRFALDADGVQVPPELGALHPRSETDEDAGPGSASSFDVDFDWRVDAALRAATRQEQGSGEADAARAALLAAAQRDDIPNPRDRARLLLGAAWIALRAQDRPSARRHLESARAVSRSKNDDSQGAVDTPLFTQELALMIDLEEPWPEELRRRFGILPATLRRNLALTGRLDTLPAALRADLDARERRRDQLRRIEAAAADLRRLDQPTALRRGDEIWVYRPAVEAPGGEGAILAAAAVPALLQTRVDLAGLRLADENSEGLRDPLPVIAGLVIEPETKEAAAASKHRVTLPIIGLGLVFVVALFATLRAVREEARAAATRADFTTMVTHELKTPLASIRLLAEMLEEDRVPDAARRAEYYRRLSGESARLGMLVENVLDLGRLEKGERTYDRRPANPDAVIAETLDVFAPLADRDGLELSRQLEGGHDEATVDRGALAQVLLNLLENARKYALSGKRLDVRTQIKDGHHHLTVRDYGPGLPPEERERIFDRFIRGEDQASGNIPGVGLGLFLARRILRDHGGDLRAESPSEGPGLTLTWTLPLTAEGSSS